MPPAVTLLSSLLALLGWLFGGGVDWDRVAAAARSEAGPAAAVPVPPRTEGQRLAARAKTEAAFGGSDAWESLPAAERERFHQYNEAALAARGAGDEAAAWAAAADYVRDAAPGPLRSGTAVGLVRYLTSRGRSDEAVEPLDLVLADPAPAGEDRYAGEILLQRATLAVAAGAEDAREFLGRLAKPFRKELGSRRDRNLHYRVSRLHARAGDHERARLYYLAAAPAGGDAAALEDYLFRGRLLAFDLLASRQPAEGLNFQLNLLKKYPEATDAAALQAAILLAARLNREDVAGELTDLLTQRFPDSPEAADRFAARGRDALMLGDRETAVESYRGVIDADGSTAEQRRSAARQLRMLGLEVDETDLSVREPKLLPVPDPIGGGPAGG